MSAKGWKTIIFNGLLALIGVAEAADWTNIIPENYVGVVLIVIGLIGQWLRAMTNQPPATASKAKLIKAKEQIETRIDKKQ